MSTLPTLNFLTGSDDSIDYRPAINSAGVAVVFERTPIKGGLTVLNEVGVLDGAAAPAVLLSEQYVLGAQRRHIAVLLPGPSAVASPCPPSPRRSPPADRASRRTGRRLPAPAATGCLGPKACPLVAIRAEYSRISSAAISLTALLAPLGLGPVGTAEPGQRGRLSNTNETREGDKASAVLLSRR